MKVRAKSEMARTSEHTHGNVHASEVFQGVLAEAVVVASAGHSHSHAIVFEAVLLATSIGGHLLFVVPVQVGVLLLQLMLLLLLLLLMLLLLLVVMLLLLLLHGG